MKTYLMTMVSLFAFTFMSTAKDVMISQKDLPNTITQYVNTHFPDQKIIQSKKDMDGHGFSYELVLTNATKLEFSSKGEILEIKSKSKLPDSVIPHNILQYVKQHFPDQSITEWEIKRRKQEIELSNDLELEFNLDGIFLKID